MADFEFGYKCINVVTCFDKLPLGVYRIVYNIYYGDSLYKRYIKTFEVFDKDSKVSPAMASGLPFVFSMPNEQKWLASNTFDLWNPKSSCDTQHYISCVTNTPIEAERQRVWEVIKPFHREWFAWLADRTLKDPDIAKHMDVAKYADYLFYRPNAQTFHPKTFLYHVDAYQNPRMREILCDFLNENPEIADKVLYKATTKDDGEFVLNDEFNETGERIEYETFTYEKYTRVIYYNVLF